MVYCAADTSCAGGGTGFAGFSKQPIIGYWEILAPIIGLVCIGRVQSATLHGCD